MYWKYDHETDKVTMMGVCVGELHTNKMLDILEKIPHSDMTEELKNALVHHEVDENVCPHCGGKHFTVRMSMGEVQSGFCRDCLTDAMRNESTGQWQTRDGRVGRHTYMFKTDHRYRKAFIKE